MQYNKISLRDQNFKITCEKSEGKENINPVNCQNSLKKHHAIPFDTISAQIRCITNHASNLSRKFSRKRQASSTKKKNSGEENLSREITRHDT